MNYILFPFFILFISPSFSIRTYLDLSYLLPSFHVRCWFYPSLCQPSTLSLLTFKWLFSTYPILLNLYIFRLIFRFINKISVSFGFELQRTLPARRTFSNHGIFQLYGKRIFKNLFILFLFPIFSLFSFLYYLNFFFLVSLHLICVLCTKSHAHSTSNCDVIFYKIKVFWDVVLTEKCQLIFFMQLCLEEVILCCYWYEYWRWYFFL